MKKAKKTVIIFGIAIIIATNLLLIWKIFYFRQGSAANPTIHSWQCSKEALEAAIWNINDYLESDCGNRQELLDGLAVNIAVCQSHLQCLEQTSGQLLLAEKKYGLSRKFTNQTSSSMLEIAEGLYILSVFIDEFQDIPIDTHEDLFRIYLMKIKLVLDGWKNHFNSYDFGACKNPKEVAALYYDFTEDGLLLYENAFHFLMEPDQ